MKYQKAIENKLVTGNGNGGSTVLPIFKDKYFLIYRSGDGDVTTARNVIVASDGSFDDQGSINFSSSEDEYFYNGLYSLSENKLIISGSNVKNFRYGIMTFK